MLQFTLQQIPTKRNKSVLNHLLRIAYKIFIFTT